MNAIRKHLAAKHVERAVGVLMAAGFDRSEATDLAKTAYAAS